MPPPHHLLGDRGRRQRERERDVLYRRVLRPDAGDTYEVEGADGVAKLVANRSGLTLAPGARAPVVRSLDGKAESLVGPPPPSQAGRSELDRVQVDVTLDALSLTAADPAAVEREATTAVAFTGRGFRAGDTWEAVRLGAQGQWEADSGVAIDALAVGSDTDATADVTPVASVPDGYRVSVRVRRGGDGVAETVAPELLEVEVPEDVPGPLAGAVFGFRVSGSAVECHEYSELGAYVGLVGSVTPGVTPTAAQLGSGTLARADGSATYEGPVFCWRVGMIGYVWDLKSGALAEVDFALAGHVTRTLYGVGFRPGLSDGVLYGMFWGDPGGGLVELLAGGPITGGAASAITGSTPVPGGGLARAPTPAAYLNTGVYIPRHNSFTDGFNGYLYPWAGGPRQTILTTSQRESVARVAARAGTSAFAGDPELDGRGAAQECAVCYTMGDPLVGSHWLQRMVITASPIVELVVHTSWADGVTGSALTPSYGCPGSAGARALTTRYQDVSGRPEWGISTPLLRRDAGLNASPNVRSPEGIGGNPSGPWPSLFWLVDYDG